MSVIWRVFLFSAAPAFIYLSAISLSSERNAENSSSVSSNVQFVSSSISFLGSTLPPAKYLANDAQIPSSDICTAFPHVSADANREDLERNLPQSSKAEDTDVSGAYAVSKRGGMAHEPAVEKPRRRGGKQMKTYGEEDL